jgi:hypothetical protein
MSTASCADNAPRKHARGSRARTTRPIEPVRRLTYTRQEASLALGVSVDHFERHIQPFMKLIPCGQLLLVPLSEIERWVRQSARALVQ